MKKLYTDIYLEIIDLRGTDTFTAGLFPSIAVDENGQGDTKAETDGWEW